ncbi:MAG: permease, partial [Serratia marcescens]|nr:permease [Serratia marcescens]
MLLKNFIDLFLDSAPWLLLGLILAGLLKVFVPMAWMQKQLGGHGFKTVVKAALLGAPLPLCSCGVIPAAVGLRRSGASKAATTSFLVSTPETGVDSVTVSYVLLGPFMAIVRPIAAITSAIVAGLLVGRDDDDGKPAAKAEALSDTAQLDKTQSDKALARAAPVASCCASKSPSPETVVKAEVVKSCCASTKAPAITPVKSSCCGSNNAKVPTTEPKIKMTPMASPSLMAVSGSSMGTVGMVNAAKVSAVKVENAGSCC